MDESNQKSNRMVFGSGIARGESYRALVEEVTDQVLKELNGEPVDLAFLFVTPHFPGHYARIQEAVQKKMKAHVILGCTAVSVIGHDREIEWEPAMSLFAAHLAGVHKVPFWLKQSGLEELSDIEKCRSYFGVSPADSPVFFILPDPFSFDINMFMERIHAAYPGSPVMGGMASGSGEPGGNTLFWTEGVCDSGAVGVVLTGNVHVSPLVSQGCRPFGEPVVITGAQENIILSLAGKPALEYLEETYRKASAKDQVLARNALFIGALADEYKQYPKRGDFVIRNVVGLDRDSGALAISDYVHLGDTVQFHVRDAETAHEDLESLCEHQKVHGDFPNIAPDPKAALIFSCNGRGSNMFKTKNHDIGTLQEHLGKFPTAGFFCAGELGPIGKKNFMHSFTASIALFYEKKPQ
ncbi:MAG: FIST C-terminal domain-containing protein [Candidatus Omnitrophica bacterium]|nr:FIST C-terminal domain-containing protein [Candidatus Omnitrophota bacterium]